MEGQPNTNRPSLSITIEQVLVRKHTRAFPGDFCCFKRKMRGKFTRPALELFTPIFVYLGGWVFWVCQTNASPFAILAEALLYQQFPETNHFLSNEFLTSQD